MAYFTEKYPNYITNTNINPNKLAYRVFSELYCWKDKNDEWMCGFEDKIATTSSKQGLEKYVISMQRDYPCPLVEMSELLSLFYDTTDPNLLVIETHYLEDGEEFKIIPLPSTNKYLYDVLNLKASYVYNVVRDWESELPHI